MKTEKIPHSTLVRGMFCLLLAISLADVAQAQTAEIKDVKPAVVQPDGILTLTFSAPVKPAAVKIGDGAGAFVSPANPVNTLDVKVPANAAPGRKEIAVTLAGDSPTVISNSVTIAPIILGLKARKDAPLEFSRVVVDGAEVILQFADKIPAELRQSLDVRLFDESTAVPWEIKSDNEKFAEYKKKYSQTICSFSIPAEDNHLILRLPKCSGQATSNLTETTYSVQVRAGGADGVLLQNQPLLRIQSGWSMILWASGVVLILCVLTYLLYKLFYKTPEGQTRFTFLKMLLLEQENQTYSLSRAQFLGWLVVIVWCYLFLYYAHGFVEEDWSFPNLGNALYAFLISLGTLVAAQATSTGMGAKGAGEVHPSLADLVVHGGVLALDRVQQVIWTLIALGMFIRITVSTYSTADALPDIPTTMLGLMGLSSVGYLGGKLVRGAGPVIDDVSISGELVVNIRGQHFSKDAFVWLDGVQLARDKVNPKVDDPDDPLKFAKELELTLSMTVAQWQATDHAITVVNNDAQRADWRTSGQILEVVPGEPDNEGNLTVTIKGAHIAKGATIQINGEPDFKPKQDAADANQFTAKVPAAWKDQAHELVLTSEGKRSSFSYPP